MYSDLKLYCAPGIQLTGLIVAWKPLDKLCCGLNMLTRNNLALDFLKSHPGWQSHTALGFHSHLLRITACNATSQYRHNMNMLKVVTKWFTVLIEKNTRWICWISYCYLDIWKRVSHCILGNSIKDEIICQNLWNRS